MINIIIVDDHAMVRSGLRMLLSAAPDIEVAAEASEGDEGIRMALEHQPDVVLMDLSMPHGKDGLTAATELKEQLPDVAVLILTMHDDDEYLFRAIHAGAAGYVLKSAPHEELLTAIRTVARGDAYLYPTATKRLMNEYVEQMRRGESTDLFDGLSEREKEVLSLTAMGYANKEIAEQLVISVKTVETHKSNLMEKLGLKTRPELIKYAMKKGLLQFE
ncbi:two-component system response regulator NreC [Paenibacillus rhizosphaerae]|uniref:Two-component system response regulator NreC n=1 Tax=Paenibacillus rhizosphaerae TaxID=297318 RepID=A0A839TJP8_9BACL|nr:response regulator transcription factor [Paenibacillus rhizosphaerae]MBB3125618.1 two-component system response regulator NreC [Paenibacillus rhizosphaerae]